AQSDRQQLRMAADLRHRLDSYLRIAPRAGVSAAEIYPAVLAWKGSVFARQQAILRAGRQPELAPRLDEWRRTVHELATPAMAPPALATSGPRQQPARRQRLEQLTLRKEQLEVDLAQHSAAFRALLARDGLTAAQVQAGLPDDTALIDFIMLWQRGPGPRTK